MSAVEPTGEQALPWLCEGCEKVVMAYEATFRVRAFLPPRGNWKTAVCKACHEGAQKEGSS